MNYALAKELKDAGFPQEIKEGSFYFAGRNLTRPYCWGGEGEDKPYHEYWLSPTLEELVEACAEDFVNLNRLAHSRPTDARWQAVGKLTKSTTQKHDGETPTIAVAKLWLALNKK